jgi:hypothetical protein
MDQLALCQCYTPAGIGDQAMLKMSLLLLVAANDA